MGRPLKGSILQGDQGTWRASVPVRRGTRERLERSFTAKNEAKAWVKRQIDRLEAGLDADDSPTADEDPAVEGPWTPTEPRVEDATSFLQNARYWVWDWYVYQQNGDPERMRDVWHKIETTMAPFMGDLLRRDPADAHKLIRAWAAALAGRSGAEGDPSFPGLAGPYAQGVSKDLLWVLRQIMVTASRFGADVPMTKEGVPAAMDGIRAHRKVGATKRRPSLVSLSITRRIAARLHVIHQTVLWLMRLAGLRISEVYGLCVANFILIGEGMGLLLIEAQGGRRFETWSPSGEIGEIETTFRKTHTKTDSGYRVIALPRLLTELIVIIIGAFHTDPETGEVDATARLIPTIRSMVGGPAGFRAALARTCRAVGEGSEDPESYVPHDLRKAYSTDLAWDTAIEPIVRRRAMGHRAGGDVFDEVYTLDDRLAESMMPIATRIDEELAAAGITTLMIPTSNRPRYGKDTAPSNYTTGVLIDAGWEVDPLEPGWINAAEAAVHLSMTETATRRLFPDEIFAVKVDGEWKVRLDDVIDYQQRFQGWNLLTDLAEHTGVTYHQAHAVMRRLAIEPSIDQPSRRLLLTDTEASQISEEFTRLDRLQERAMRTGQAAACLNVAHSTIQKWANEGKLEVDAETDATGGRYITRRSVQAELERRNATVVAVPIEQIAEYAGMHPDMVAELVNVDILIAGRDGVTLESLRRWAVGHRPDLLTMGLLRRGDATHWH